MVWWKMLKILDQWKQAKLQDQIQINAGDLSSVRCATIWNLRNKEEIFKW